MRRAGIAVICSLLLFGCSRDPHDLRITAKNKDTFIDEIKDMKGLTVDETRLLATFQIRRSRGNATGASSEDPSGKTVGELLAQLKKQAAEEQTQARRQQLLADEAKAKADALAAELRKSIDLTVYNKAFITSSNQITIKCAYQNSSTKGIRAFRGQLQFADLFGSEIFTTTLTISDPIASGKKGNRFVVIENNEFIRSHQQLFNTELKDVKVIWIPEAVIFVDGSKIGEGPLRRESDSPRHRPNPHPQLPSDPRQA
jgi:hypothetical protein